MFFMKNILTKTIFLILIILNFFPRIVFANSVNNETTTIDLKTAKIKTQTVSMDTYIDNSSETYRMLSENEVEDLFNSVSNKSFKELSKINFNHEENSVKISFMINEDDGNTDLLINTSIYNFLNGIKEVVNYSIDFEAIVRYTDSNGRYLKKPLYRYSYETENLIAIDWENVDFKEMTSLCNEIYCYETDETIKTNVLNKDNMQVKIINILKYYIGEKINNKKDLTEG